MGVGGVHHPGLDLTLAMPQVNTWNIAEQWSATTPKPAKKTETSPTVEESDGEQDNAEGPIAHMGTTPIHAHRIR